MLDFNNITLNDLSAIAVALFASAKGWAIASGWLRSRGAKRIENATADSQAEKAKQEALVTETKELELQKKKDAYYEEQIKKLQDKNTELAKNGESVSRRELQGLIEAYAQSIISRKIEGLQKQVRKLFAESRAKDKTITELRETNKKILEDNEALKKGYCPILAGMGECEHLQERRCRDPV